MRVSEILITNDSEDLSSVVEALGTSVSVNRAYVFDVHDGGRRMSNTYEWCEEGTKAQIDRLQNLPTAMFPWWTQRLQNGQNVIVEDVARLPPEAGAEKEILQSQGIQAVLVVPISSGSALQGFLGFDDTISARRWYSEDIAFLKMAAEMILAHRARLKAHAAHAELEEELRAALAQRLSEDLSICSHCKRIQDTEGHWIPLETYVHNHTPTRLSSEVCPYCKRKLFPHFYST